jgi:hypothetical protein
MKELLPQNQIDSFKAKAAAPVPFVALTSKLLDG